MTQERLQEQMYVVIHKTKYNSDTSMMEGCVKLAQIYAIEQQIELIGSIKLDNEGCSKTLDSIYLGLKDQLLKLYS